jgi:hypothetical protein
VSRSQARYEFDRWLDISEKVKSGHADRTMVFDRVGDQDRGMPWYDEIVTDPDTGETITDKHYPLHGKPASGSAKG